MAIQASDKAVESGVHPASQAAGAKDETVNSEKDLERSDLPTKDSDSDKISEDAQAGVRAIQGATSVWSKWHLAAAYANVWLIYVVIAIQSNVQRSLNPYVTSAFKLHSLTATIGIVSSIIGGLCYIPLSKILDTWGRPQGLAVTVFFWIIGFIMMAGCNNVETYAAAQVFSTIGATGVSYTITVFMSDTSSLKSRALALAFASSPYVAFTWVGGPIAQSLLKGAGWRWGMGLWAIVCPVAVLPLAGLLWWNQRKAEKLGVIQKPEYNLTWAGVKNYLIEVDIVGCILLAGGMALFLLPFSLYSYQANGWRSPMIICMIVFGLLLLVSFVLYERYVAPVTFIPFHLLMDRTVFLTGIMFIFIYFNSNVWGSYFSSMLQVVWELNVADAGYVNSAHRVTQCLWGIAIGFIIRWSGRFKWVQLSLGVPLMMLAVGLMYHFRTDQAAVGLIVMTQIFAGASSGAVVLCGEMAMMSPSDHQHIAAIIAILNLFCSMGSAVGGTVSAAIWTGVFPKKLKEYLPEGTNIAPIYGDLKVQIGYASGSPERLAIKRAYADSQKLMFTTSLCLLAGALICVVFWRDIKVKQIKQTKGVVA
ncbi:unnamed protein product [Clonostachys rosea f. rosea IK726]|uniref:Major facilitator superfamily (MFS) profile domain-containing protein n=2 Tax=Bionectria ochroleuca TaxID=29856 RepID=A0A0B7KDT1_BIOOC|nr:unnamed protein product [Clonostachys rosea f. rosea IK726]